MKNKLPKNWVITRINEVYQVSKQNGEVGKHPYLEIGNVNLSNKDYSLTEKLSVKGCKVGLKDDVLISRVRPTRGAVTQIKENKVYISSAFTNLRNSFKLNNKLIFYYLAYNLNFFHFLGRNCTGAMYPTVGEDIILDYPVPLPPLAEQNRIVKKLDSIFEKIEYTKKPLDEIPKILKRFRQSVLNAAVTGKLTENWRGEGEDTLDEEYKFTIPANWRITEFHEIIEKGPQNGIYKPQSDYGNGALILRIDNFYDGRVTSWGLLKRLKVNNIELKTYSLQNNDIVVNRVNSMPYLGKSALIEGLTEDCVFESNMMRIKIKKEDTLPKYIIHYLNSLKGFKELRKNAKHAVNQSSINQQDVKAVKVPLPSIKEQKEIIKRVDKLFSFADKLEAKYNFIKQQIDILPHSIHAKAFSGELVDQDPNDEPASVLLERIREEKEKMGKGKKVKG